MKNFASNAKGSTLIIVLILIASVLATTAAIMQSTANLSQIYAQKSSGQIADNVAQLISAVAADNNICLNGFDGPLGEPGLQFHDASGNQINFALNLASLANKLDVSLPSNIPDPAAVRFRFIKNFSIVGSDLQIDRLYVTGAVVDPANPNAYTVDLMAQFQSSQGGNTRGLNVRKIMRLRLTTSAGNLSACGYAPSADSNKVLCEAMNCTYTTAPNGANSCYCAVKPIACNGGTYVQTPIIGFTPQCTNTTVTRTCGAAVGSYLVALDALSNPVCAQVVACPAGTSAFGLGGPANPPECKCTNAGQTWNNGACAVVAAPVCAGTIRTLPQIFIDPAPPNQPGVSWSPQVQILCTQQGFQPWSESYVGVQDKYNPVCCDLGGGPLCVADGQEESQGALCNAGDPAISAPVPNANCCSGTATVRCGPPAEPASIVCGNGIVPAICPAGSTRTGTVTYATKNLCQAAGGNCPAGDTYAGRCLGPAPFAGCCTPPVVGCPPGSSPAGLGISINATCRCDAATDSWDGTSCATNSYCGFSFNGMIATSFCTGGGEPPEALGGTCASPFYRDFSIPDNTCTVNAGTTYPVVACNRCGPGSNIPAGNCTPDPACGPACPLLSSNLVTNWPTPTAGCYCVSGAWNPAIGGCEFNLSTECIAPDNSNPGTWQKFTVLPPAAVRTGPPGSYLISPISGTPCGKKGFWCEGFNLNLNPGDLGGGLNPPQEPYLAWVCQ